MLSLSITTVSFVFSTYAFEPKNSVSILIMLIINNELTDLQRFFLWSNETSFNLSYKNTLCAYIFHDFASGVNFNRIVFTDISNPTLAELGSLFWDTLSSEAKAAFNAEAKVLQQATGKKMNSFWYWNNQIASKLGDSAVGIDNLIDFFLWAMLAIGEKSRWFVLDVSPLDYVEEEINLRCLTLY